MYIIEDIRILYPLYIIKVLGNFKWGAKAGHMMDHKQDIVLVKKMKISTENIKLFKNCGVFGRNSNGSCRGMISSGISTIFKVCLLRLM